MDRAARRAITPASAFLLALILTAGAFWTASCGSSQDASDLFLEAVDNTSRLQSVRATFVMEGYKGDMGSQLPLLSLVGTMGIDLTANAMEVSSTMPVIGTPLGLRVVDGALYLNFAGRWMSNPESFLAGLGFEALGRNLPTLSDLFQLTKYFSQVRRICTENVDGEDCERLAVMLDFSKIAGSDQLPEFLLQMAGGAPAAGEAIQKSNLTMEAWVAKDSHLVKQALFSFNLDLPRIPVLDAFLPQGPAGFRVMLRLADFNEPVEVEVPAGAAPPAPNLIP